MGCGIALGYVNHSHFEVEAERELAKERRHIRRKGNKMTMRGKRKVKERDIASVSRSNHEQWNDRKVKA